MLHTPASALTRDARLGETCLQRYRSQLQCAAVVLVIVILGAVMVNLFGVGSTHSPEGSTRAQTSHYHGNGTLVYLGNGYVPPI